MSSTAERWPFDLETIPKGTAVPVATLEPILGANFLTDRYRYQYRLMDLAGKVEKRLRDMGRPMTVAIEHGQLLFLDDAEASVYNAELFRSYLRRAMKSNRRHAEVDTANLDDKQLVKHVRTSRVQGAILVGIATARRQALQAEPYRRRLPIPQDH